MSSQKLWSQDTREPQIANVSAIILHGINEWGFDVNKDYHVDAVCSALDEVKAHLQQEQSYHKREVAKIAEIKNALEKLRDHRRLKGSESDAANRSVG